MSEAFKHKKLYKDWLFADIGFIDESIRDSIAIIADFLVQRINCMMVVVFAVVENKTRKTLRLDASFRSDNESFDLNKLIKQISPSGGGRKYKGAYQVDLNYFADCPDKELLWESIDCTTRSKLKHLRNQLQAREIKGIYKKIKGKFDSIIKS